LYGDDASTYNTYSHLRSHGDDEGMYVEGAHNVLHDLFVTGHYGDGLWVYGEGQTVATCHRHYAAFLPQFFNNCSLLVWQDLGLDFRYPKPSRHGLGGRAVVTGQHDDAYAFGDERLKRIRRALFDGIGNSDHPGQLVVDGEEDRSCAILAQPLGLALKRRGRDTEFSEIFRIAECHTAVFDHPCNALAGRRIEVLNFGKCNFSLGCRGDDGGSQRMFACTFDTGRKAQYVLFVDSFSRDDGNSFRLTLGKRARLVDNERVDLLHALQRLGIFD
jgi:hypothetical protein